MRLLIIFYALLVGCAAPAAGKKLVHCFSGESTVYYGIAKNVRIDSGVVYIDDHSFVSGGICVVGPWRPIDNDGGRK